MASAVLLLLHKITGEEHLLFTERSQEVAHHKGQVCFPGGVRDEKDKNLWETALRETEEEIHLPRAHIEYIGELGFVVTPTGYHMTPYVGYVRDLPELKPSAIEINKIFHAPVKHFLNPECFRLVERIYFEQKIEDPIYTYQEYEIWGASARILRDFLKVWKSV